MQSKSLLTRIWAMVLCLALVLSCLPGLTIFSAAAAEPTATEAPATGSTATEATEAASDLLKSSLSYNKTHWENIPNDDGKEDKLVGLTAEKNSNQVYGSQSLNSWEFKAAVNATGSATAQIQLNKTIDFLNNYLVMDVLYVTEGAEEEMSISARLHGTNWGDLNIAQSFKAKKGEWKTVVLQPAASGAMAGKDINGLATSGFITFSLNFNNNSEFERAVYIDNVRAMKIETAREDWIHMPVDAGMTKVDSYEIVNELSVDKGSSQSLKLYTTKDMGSICFQPQTAVGNADPNKQLDALPDMTSGILSGWFYFGEAAPSGKVELTYSDCGVSNAVDFTFEAKGNGWYYGTLDCTGFTTTSAATEKRNETYRLDIEDLPKAATIYIDCLTFAKEAIDGLSIAYPYNTETYQQNATPTNRFEALTFNTARNEVETAQMILSPSFDVAGYELTMGNLVNASGNVISAADFEVYNAHYVTVEGSKNGGAQVTNPDGEVIWNPEAHTGAGVDGVFPNALIPQAASIAKGENVIASGNNQAVWVNLNVGDAAPGTYTGSATLTVNGQKMQIPVSVTVYDAELPDEVHVKSSFQIWWDMLEMGEGEINGTLARAYENYLISKRIMPMDTWNITRYDEAFVNYVPQWAADPKISSYGLRYAKDAEGGLDTAALTVTLTAIINKNIELAQSGSDVDLFKKAYLYFGQIDDEPRDAEEYAIVNTLTAQLDTIKAELSPMLADYPALQNSFNNLKHLVTGPDPLDKTYAFLPAQDYGNTAMTGNSYTYVPQYQWLHTEEQRALYADQEELWWYGCTHPVNPYPSYSFNSPLIGVRATGWMMYDYDIDGILSWCVNCWSEKDVLKDIWGTYGNCPGEGILVLPGKDYGVTGPIGTIRLETIREANEDYEYLWMLENEYGISDISAYTANMYDGVIPSTDVTVHHNNRIALLDKLEDLSIAANGATVAEPNLPVMPVDPQPEPEIINYPVDIIKVGTCSTVTEQTDVVNGDDSAWKISGNTTSTWIYPTITLDKTYDISDHMLVLDVKTVNVAGRRVQLAKLNASWVEISSGYKNLTQWGTLTYALLDNKHGITEMDSLTLGFEVPANTDYEIYIDNIYLVPLEDVNDDWIHVAQDTGDSYCNCTTSLTSGVLKAQNSGMSMKVVAPAGASGKFTLNTGTMANKPDFTTGTLAAWFYFGDETPNVNVRVTASNWKGSIAHPMSFVYGGNGWYYGTLDTSDIKFAPADQTGGDGNPTTLKDIIRLTFDIPAGYSGYVDGITFNAVENVTPIIREDLSADWTNLPANGGVLTEDVHYAEGSHQSLLATADTVTITPEGALNLVKGTLGAWFYFGENEPSAVLTVIDGDGGDSSWDEEISFTFGEGVDGWYYGTVDCAAIVDGGMVDAAAIAEINIVVAAGTYIDCLTYTPPVDKNDLFAHATAADTQYILNPNSNYFYDANSAVTYGESSTKSWMIGGNADASGWPTALIRLDKSYDMTGKNLVFDVKTEGGRGYIALASLHNTGWANVCAKDSFNASATFDADGWHTVSFSLEKLLGEGKSLSDIKFIKLGLDMDTNKGVERKYYIDNVRLLRVETLDEDLLNLGIDAGESTAGTYEKVENFTKGESALAMKLTPTLESGAKVSLNVNASVLGDNYDMSTGTLGAWFYFGDQTPSATLNFSGNWKASVPVNFTFGTGVDGWYYGKVDLTAISFYEAAGTMADIERIRISIPAGYAPVYVDYLTYDADGATITQETGMLYNAAFSYNSANWTEATGLSYGKEYYETNGSYQAWAYKATASAASNGVAQMQMTQTYDATGKVLLFDIKSDCDIDIKVRLHRAEGWADVTADKTLSVKSNDGWVTYILDPNSLVLDGKDLTTVKFITFTFNFTANTGAERAVYIDNVRMATPETVEQDMINISMDKGPYYYNCDTGLTDEMVKADGSTLSLKVITPADADGMFTFNTQSMNLDFTNGTVGAWFYFGDQEPRASLIFTASNDRGSVPASFVFGENNGGWYYGTVNTSNITFYEPEYNGVASTLNGVYRVKIKLPAGNTYYIDGLNFEPNPVSKWGIVLSDDIAVHFNLTVAEAANITVSVNSGEPYAVQKTLNDDGTYGVVVELAAAQMTDSIAIYVDGEYVGKDYTVRQYADHILSGEYTEAQKNLVRYMLAYGGAAQNYFGYYTDRSAAADIAVTAKTPEGYNALAVSGTVDGIKFYGASLLHKEKTGVRIYFTGSADGLTVTYGENVMPTVASGDKFYVDILGINPQDLDKVITVKAANEAGEELSVSYSPLTYILRMYSKDSSTELTKALVQALYGYFTAAQELTNG